MIDKNVVETIVEEWLQNGDYFLVDISMSPDHRIVVEIDHADGVWIEDCAELSRFVQERLGEELDDYDLEVGSAGLGQPFKVARQYVNHVGKDVEVLTAEGRKVQGVLKAVDGDRFTVTVREKQKVEGKKRPVMADVDYEYVMRSESRGGIVKLPEGDQAKDVTRYTDRIVNHMISHMVKRVREVLNKYVSITITDMTDLIPELLYYIKWAEYIQKLQEQGFTFAKASVYKEGENESDPYMMQARGIYNLKLAVFETEESGNIVPNDMDFDRNRRVYILTGANRGGKTTITQAVGQLFVLAQGGIYIPGKAFT